MAGQDKDGQSAPDGWRCKRRQHSPNARNAHACPPAKTHARTPARHERTHGRTGARKPTASSTHASTCPTRCDEPGPALRLPRLEKQEGARGREGRVGGWGVAKGGRDRDGDERRREQAARKGQKIMSSATIEWRARAGERESESESKSESERESERKCEGPRERDR